MTEPQAEHKEPPERTSLWARVENLFESMGGVLIFIMMWGIMADVVGRYFLRSPVPNVPEFSAMVMPVIAFAGMAALTARNGNVRITALVRYLPDRARRVIYLVFTVMAFLAMAIVAWQSYVSFLQNYANMSLREATVPFVLWPFRLLAAIGGMLLCVRFLINIWGALHGSPQSAAVEE